jgi:hypothetical protein
MKSAGRREATSADAIRGRGRFIPDCTVGRRFAPIRRLHPGYGSWIRNPDISRPKMTSENKRILSVHGVVFDVLVGLRGSG